MHRPALRTLSVLVFSAQNRIPASTTTGAGINHVVTTPSHIHSKLHFCTSHAKTNVEDTSNNWLERSVPIDDDDDDDDESSSFSSEPVDYNVGLCRATWVGPLSKTIYDTLAARHSSSWNSSNCFYNKRERGHTQMPRTPTVRQRGRASHFETKWIGIK
jgi:hypothetical protein